MRKAKEFELYDIYNQVSSQLPPETAQKVLRIANMLQREMVADSKVCENPEWIEKRKNSLLEVLNVWQAGNVIGMIDRNLKKSTALLSP
jgi:hypothetical protein